MRTSISLSSTAGSTTTKPAMPASRPSLELASTSSASSRHHGGHERALGDRVGLGQHQEQEGQGEQPEAGDVHHQEGGDDGPAGAGDDHHQAPSALHPVEGRAEQRGDHGERRHGQEQVEGHLAAGGLRADVEEQRAGQRDGHRGVAGRRRGVGPGEPGERRDDQPAGEVLGRTGRAAGSARPVRRPERLPRGGRAHRIVRSPPLGRFASLTVPSALRRSGGSLRSPCVRSPPLGRFASLTVPSALRRSGGSLRSRSHRRQPSGPDRRWGRSGPGRLVLVAEAPDGDDAGRGWPGRSSTLARRRLTWTSSVLVSPT